MKGLNHDISFEPNKFYKSILLKFTEIQKVLQGLAHLPNDTYIYNPRRNTYESKNKAQ